MLLMIDSGSSRFIRENNGVMMNSDGIYNAAQRLEAAPVTCQPPYSFLPCTNDFWGLIFLIVMYQYLLSLGQKYVSAASDLFFKTHGPGIFGASLFHLIGILPQISLILVSRLRGDLANAETQSGSGMSILAGGAALNLTLIWGTSVFLGSYNLSDDSTATSTQVKQKPTILSSLTGSGVTTDVDTSYTARIMIVSVVPLLILQLANIVKSPTGSQWVVLISLIVTLSLFFSYSLYQIFQPWIQNRRLEYLNQKLVKDKLLRLLSVKGKPNIALIRQIFHEMDKSNDPHISPSELRAFVLGIQIEDDGLIKEDYADMVKEVFEVSDDNKISEVEFVKGLSKWLSQAEQTVTHRARKLFNKNSEEAQPLLEQNRMYMSLEDARQNYLGAGLLMLVGTAISVLLAFPLMTTVVQVATVTNVSSFFIPYIVFPSTLGFRSFWAIIASAQQKTQKSISLTLSQIYESVFMSNVVGLTTFLIVVYIRNLPVDAPAEILVAIVICTVMGVFTSFRTKFPLWTSILAILLYPISFFVLYLLTVVYGW